MALTPNSHVPVGALWIRTGLNHDDVIKWKHFRVTGPLCGEFAGPGEFPTQRPVTRSFDVFFDLRLNKRLSKQPWGRWFETPSWSLWRHCDVYGRTVYMAHNVISFCIVGYVSMFILQSSSGHSPLITSQIGQSRNLFTSQPPNEWHFLYLWTTKTSKPKTQRVMWL